MGKRLLKVLLVSVLLLSGCSWANSKDAWPGEMPDDFAFSLNYGLYGKNRVDTFTGVIRKDLIAAGAVEAPFEFTEQELHSIYRKMNQIRISETKKLSNNSCVVEPSQEDAWRIRV